MKIRPIIFFISILSTLVSFAAIKIQGLVTDENNEPLEFVSVRIDGTAIGATTGLDGKYTISAPEADTIRVIFSCIGYEESKRRLLSPAGDVTVNVKMQPKSYQLQGVEVTDIQKQTGSLQKINPNSGKL